MTEAMAQLQIVAATTTRRATPRARRHPPEDGGPRPRQHRVRDQARRAVRARSGQPAAALEWFRRAAEYLKRNSRADEYLRVAERIAVARAGRPRAHARARAPLPARKGDTKRALAKLQLCFKADPRDVETLQLLAQAFQRSGPDVEDDLRLQGARARPRGARAARDEARAVWRKVQELAPDDPERRGPRRQRGPRRGAASGGDAAPPAFLGSARFGPAVTPPPTPGRAPLAGAAPERASPAPVGTAPAAPRRRPAGGAAAIPKLLTETDVYVKYGLHDKALDHLRKVLAIDPELPDAHERARDVHVARGPARTRRPPRGVRAVRAHSRAGEPDRARDALAPPGRARARAPASSRRWRAAAGARRGGGRALARSTARSWCSLAAHHGGAPEDDDARARRRGRTRATRSSRTSRSGRRRSPRGAHRRRDRGPGEPAWTWPATRSPRPPRSPRRRRRRSSTRSRRRRAPRRAATVPAPAATDAGAARRRLARGAYAVPGASSRRTGDAPGGPAQASAPSRTPAPIRRAPPRARAPRRRRTSRTSSRRPSSSCSRGSSTRRATRSGDLLASHPGHPVLEARLAEVERRAGRGASRQRPRRPPPRRARRRRRRLRSATRASTSRASSPTSSAATRLRPPTRRSSSTRSRTCSPSSRRASSRWSSPRTARPTTTSASPTRRWGCSTTRIHEFEVALQGADKRSAIDCLSMIGLCRMAKGDAPRGDPRLPPRARVRRPTDGGGQAVQYELGGGPRGGGRGGGGRSSSCSASRSSTRPTATSPTHPRRSAAGRAARPQDAHAAAHAPGPPSSGRRPATAPAARRPEEEHRVPVVPKDARVNYLEYYELSQEPFSNAPVSRFYYSSAQHSQALTRLTHAVSLHEGPGGAGGRHRRREDHARAAHARLAAGGGVRGRAARHHPLRHHRELAAQAHRAAARRREPGRREARAALAALPAARRGSTSRARRPSSSSTRPRCSPRASSWRSSGAC